jgi:hypothetical protein
VNSRDRQRIVGTLIDISRNMISSAGKTKYRNLKVVGSKLVVDQHADKFDAVVADLLKKHRWSEKYSEQHLSTALGELVHSIGQTGPELTKEEFDRFVRDFQRYSDKQVVYVPIQNIILQQKTLKFGGVTFKKMTGYQIKVVGRDNLKISKSRVTNVIFGNSSESWPERQRSSFRTAHLVGV